MKKINGQNSYFGQVRKMANAIMVGQVDTTHPKIVRSRSTSRLKRFNGSQEMMNTMITEASRYMVLALGLAYIYIFLNFIIIIYCAFPPEASR